MGYFGKSALSLVNHWLIKQWGVFHQSGKLSYTVQLPITYTLQQFLTICTGLRNSTEGEPPVIDDNLATNNTFTYHTAAGVTGCAFLSIGR